MKVPTTEAEFRKITAQVKSMPMFCLTISPGVAFQVIATIQLACRHEKYTSTSRKTAEAFARTLIEQFSGDARALLELGWNPDLDTPPASFVDHQRCRVCGCTDDDCTRCYERTGEECYWVEPDLCSACVPGGGR